MLLFAHLSDTHLDGADTALRRTRAVMRRLREMPLAAVLVTGDIADHGAVAEYEQAAAELVADVPVLVLPGNHDERGAFRKVLLGAAAAGGAVRDAAGDGPVNRAQVVDGVLFALCDSSIPGRDDGRLAPETLAWLRATLAAHQGPALVCLHHPPVMVHHPLLDGIRLGNPDDLAAVLADRPNVAGVLCGHAHLAASTGFAGRPLVVAPGVVSTVRLPWTSPRPLTWDDVVEADEPPGVAFHVLDDTGGLTTHFRSVREPQR